MNRLHTSKSIISVSRRTDIPSFYAEWLIRRLRAGHALVKNPFNPAQVRKVPLIPEDVAAIVFWTRNFSPMIPHLDWLRDKNYRSAILWTITGYGAPLESCSVPVDEAIEALRKTSALIGSHKIAWRYDPIIIDDELSPHWHIDNFTRIAERLSGSTHRVIISLMTPYRSVVSRLKRAGIDSAKFPLERSDVREMLTQLPQIAHKFGIERVQACCQGGTLAALGIPDGACIDAEWLSHVLDVEISVAKDTGQRDKCMCAKSIDIGAYDTCPRGCRYCYAVKNVNAARKFAAKHDPKDEILR